MAELAVVIVLDDPSTRATCPIEELESPASGHHNAEGVLVGRSDVDQPGLRGNGVDNDALVVDRNADDTETLKAEQLDDRRVARLFHRDHCPRVEHYAGDEVNRVSRAGGDDDLIRSRGHASGTGHPGGQSSAQLRCSGWIPVRPGSLVEGA